MEKHTAFELLKPKEGEKTREYEGYKLDKKLISKGWRDLQKLLLDVRKHDR